MTGGVSRVPPTPPSTYSHGPAPLLEVKKSQNCWQKTLKVTLKKECPKRNHKCSWCKLKGKYEFLTCADHLEKCPRKRVHCPNKSMGAQQISTSVM